MGDQKRRCARPASEHVSCPCRAQESSRKLLRLFDHTASYVSQMCSTASSESSSAACNTVYFTRVFLAGTTGHHPANPAMRPARLVGWLWWSEGVRVVVDWSSFRSFGDLSRTFSQK